MNWKFFKKALKNTTFLFLILFLILTTTVVFIFGQTLSALPKGIFGGQVFHECMVTRMYQISFCPNDSTKKINHSLDQPSVRNNKIKYVPLKQIANSLKKSVLITEDSGFYQHKGFDFVEIKKSYETNIIEGTYKRGGSTISQQLVKNLFLTQEKTMQRKALEAFYTIQLEKHLTKDQILERYLNVVQFGKEIFGIESAANFYFKKTSHELSLNESVFLSILLPNPIKYAQSYYRQKLSIFAFSRMKDVLNKLYTFERITESEYAESIDQLPIFFKNGIEKMDMDIMEDSNLDNEESAE